MRTLRLRNPPMTGALPFQHGLLAAGIKTVTLLNGTRGTIHADDLYDPPTARGCEILKWRFGYPLSAIHRGNEYAGDQLLGYLTGQVELPAEYKKRRKQRLAETPGDHDTNVRAACVREFDWVIANAGRFVYATVSDPLVRPYPRFYGPIPAHGTAIDAAGRVHTDCTGCIGFVCYRGRSPDPHGQQFNGQGYTGTLLAHLPPITLGQVKPADLAVWIDPRRPTGHHAAMFLRRDGGDWEMGSFGSNPPRHIGYQDETAVQARLGATRVRCLRLLTS